MKFLRKMLDGSRKHFEEGGKLQAAKPLFDAMDNFMFAPSTRTLTSPHVRDPLDVKRFMSMVIIGLLPCLVASVYFFGLRVLAMIIVSYAVGGMVEVAFGIIRKEEINEGFLVTGLIFPLILPPTLPLWMVGVGVAFGVLIGKELFGGTGRNLFNPAILGRCFLALAYAKPMVSGWTQPILAWPGRLLQYVTVQGPDNARQAVDVISGKTIDALSGATPLGAADGEVVGSMQMFVGNISGSIGETSALAIIAGGLFLLLTRVANWRSVVGVLGSFAILGGLLHYFRPEQFVAVQWHLMAGGLLFGAFFMVTDPVTSPSTNGGKWMYGIVIGVVTCMIRNFTDYAEGMMFAILLGNIFAPVLDEMVFRASFRRLQNER